MCFFIFAVSLLGVCDCLFLTLYHCSREQNIYSYYPPWCVICISLLSRLFAVSLCLSLHQYVSVKFSKPTVFISEIKKNILRVILVCILLKTILFLTCAIHDIPSILLLLVYIVVNSRESLHSWSDRDMLLPGNDDNIMCRICEQVEIVRKIITIRKLLIQKVGLVTIKLI